MSAVAFDADLVFGQILLVRIDDTANKNERNDQKAAATSVDTFERTSLGSAGSATRSGSNG